MIRNIGIEEGGRILTDGNRTIKFERVDRGYEMYELIGNRYTRCGCKGKRREIWLRICRKRKRISYIDAEKSIS